MAADFFLTQGDLVPSISMQLGNPDGTLPDLTGASIWLRYRPLNGDSTNEVLGVATIVGAPTNATVRYDWAVPDTATPGVLLADWKVTFVSGKTESFPSDGYLRIKIKAKP
jgi:hypothetical protein